MSTGVGVGTILKDKAVILGAFVTLTALGALTWICYVRGQPDDQKKAKPAYTFMHCPKCNDELPYSLANDGTTCKSCGKGSYTPTPKSIKKGGGDSDNISWGKLITFGVISLILIEGWIFLYVRRGRALQKAFDEAQNRLLISQCPYCSRKVKHPIARASTGIVCAGCKTAFVLTGEEEANVPVA